jgi:predicted DsbA family dithiol-disulfide isomerase
MRQTIDSHRLLAKAFEQGGEKMQRDLQDRIFAGYFENSKDPGDHDWLAEEGAEAQMGSKEEEG